MRDYVSIGPSPCDEDCVQLGAQNYEALAKEECLRFIKLILNMNLDDIMR
jgi:hypothetical protein